MVIRVAHDFICPWCWIGLFQAQALQTEFGVTTDWVAYELFPEGMEFPTPSATPEPESNRPKTPSRIALAYAAQGIEAPTNKFKSPVRTHAAHEAVEFAKTIGVADALNERLYRAFWTEAQDISSPDVIRACAQGIVPDADALMAAIEERRFADNIVGFDDAAYATGVYNVPTFFIGDERYAEQPLAVLRKAVQALS